VTFRYATPCDGPALDRLAQLDSSRIPDGPLLIAEVQDELWAAVSLDDGAAIADPFHPTAALLRTLHERARQLRLEQGRHLLRIRRRRLQATGVRSGA
jgi:hypothetical protein